VKVGSFRLEGMDPTPIVVATWSESRATSCYRDDPPRARAGVVADLRNRSGDVSQEGKSAFTDMLAGVMSRNPRSRHVRMTHRSSMLERMRFLSVLDEDIAALYEDGEKAALTSREQVKRHAAAERLPEGMGIIGMKTDGRPISVATVTFPEGGGEVASIMHDAMGPVQDVVGCLDHGSLGPRLHVAATGMTSLAALGAIVKACRTTTIPFAIGPRLAVMNPYAWAICHALLQSGQPSSMRVDNACRPSRSKGTRQLRIAHSAWLAAKRTADEITNGIHDPETHGPELEIEIRPDDAVLDEALAYATSIGKHVGERFATDLEKCLAAPRSRDRDPR
jgi:hypothetical protein